MKTILSPLALALALTVPCAHAADEIYRSVMPDGGIRYGESPDPNAKSVKKVPAPPPTTGVIIVRPGETAPPARGGGVAVLPPPPHPPNDLQERGTFQRSNSDLPKRSY